MEFNSCAKLKDTESYKEASSVYDKLIADGQDPFAKIVSMQFLLQEKLAEKYPDRCMKPSELDTLGKKYDWVRDNKIAFDDEFAELVSALGGMSRSDKDRSSLWKKWKSNHDTLRAEKFSNMNADDKLELAFEFVDALHFFVNMMLALEISAKDMFVLYYAKNSENFRRYENNY